MTMPDVTFAIASFNAAAHLQAAVESGLRQRRVAVEVLIVDDRSTDDRSWDLAQELARRDPRVRCLRLPENLGPGGARNLALDHARGSWIAVLDSDDLIHPDRSRRLIDEAVRTGADVVSDDLLIFDESGTVAPTLFLGSRACARIPTIIDLPHYLNETIMFGPRPNLGFLKPMVRTDFIRHHAIRYDDRLRIAEDDDFILQLLMAGARYRLHATPLYFYRKHSASISHRLSVDHVERMVAADDRLLLRLATADRSAKSALNRRSRGMRNARAFVHLIEAVRTRNPALALRWAVTHPGALALLRMPIAGALRKTLPRSAASRPAPTPDPRHVLFISRQRIVGATNGSSAYLLALAEATRAAGLVPHLLQPSPTLFGRTPFFRLRPEMACFETIRIRGAIRLGSRFFARDIGIYAAAVRGLIARAARRFGIGAAWAQDRKAPYAIGTPWLAEDALYVARYGRGTARVALADYVFQAEAFPYLLDPDLRSATVMHDLFSARSSQFGDNGTGDSVDGIDEAREIELLGKADAVIAIQQTEAQFVQRHVPGTTAILAPMACRPVATAQPGDAHRLLFVGSNTAPNVVGLRWFFDEVWPKLRHAAPTLELDVAGTVAAAFDSAPRGVRFRGMVDDLAALYAAAGVVISPLRQGSGLKIKLVEALAHGKACVVTGVTLQGVEQQLAAAVLRADDAAAFVEAVLNLHHDIGARKTLCEAALACATRDFGPEAAFADFRDWLVQPT